MRLILSNLPEKLSDEEIDEMLRTADKGGLISENIYSNWSYPQRNEQTHYPQKLVWPNPSKYLGKQKKEYDMST